MPIDPSFVVVAACVFYSAMYLFTYMITNDDNTSSEPLRLDSRDTTKVIVVDLVASLILKQMVTIPVYIASMFGLFVCSCFYVATMARYRHEDEMKVVKRLFG